MSGLSTKYRYVARNSIALFIGNFASKLLVFFLLPLYTSILTTEEYAIADLINTTSNLLFVVLSLSISDAILRFAMDESNDKTQILSVGLMVFGAGSIIAIALGVGVSVLPAFSAYAEYAVIAVFLYVFASLERILASFVKGLENIKLISIVGVISTSVVVFSNIIMLVYLRWAVTGYLLSYVYSHLVACVIYFFVGKVYRYFRLQRVDKRFFAQMLAYSVPLIFTQICWQLDASAAKYVVAYFSDEATVGMLSAAHKVPAVLTLVTTLFTQAWNLSAIKEEGTEGAKAFYGDMFEMYISFIMLGGGVMILFVQVLGAFLLQGEFFAAWRYMPFHILAFIFNSISAFLGSFYLAKKQTKALFGAVALGTVVNIVLSIILFRCCGLVGTGIAVSIGYLLIAALRLHKCNREKLFAYNRMKLIFSLVVLTVLCICMTFEEGMTMYLHAGLLYVMLVLINFRTIASFLRKLLGAFVKKR